LLSFNCRGFWLIASIFYVVVVEFDAKAYLGVVVVDFCLKAVSFDVNFVFFELSVFVVFLHLN